MVLPCRLSTTFHLSEGQFTSIHCTCTPSVEVKPGSSLMTSNHGHRGSLRPTSKALLIFHYLEMSCTATNISTLVA